MKNKLSIILSSILIILIICAISYTLYLKNALNNLNILSINTTNDYSNLANNVVEKYHCYKETNEKDKIIIDHQEIETNDEMNITDIKEEKTTYYLSKKDYFQSLNDDIIERDDNKKMIKTNVKNDYLNNNPITLISDYIYNLGSSYVCGG